MNNNWSQILQGAFGLALLVFFVGFEIAILWKIWRGDLSLNKLLCETNGDASMSRLQLLIFTFLIAISFFYLTVSSKDGKFPDIPPAILTLLGISGSTYLVSKGIQFASPNGTAQPSLIVSPNAAKVVPGTTLIFSVSNTSGTTGTGVQASWGLDAPAVGHLAQTGNTVVYTPAVDALPNTTVTIRAQAPGFADGVATINY